mgnify:FL=1
MQRYFCDSNEEVVTLSSDDSYHITKVMRMNVGDNIELVSNNKLYIAEIIKTTPSVIVKKNSIQESFDTNINIDIAQSIVVEQKMDYILQKGTELGVNKFIPLIVDRSVVKLNDKSDKKQKRWQTIVKEAAEQSKRLEVPTVANPCNIKELAKLDYDFKILCSVNETSKNIKTVLSNISISDRILVVVGPEGGFTNLEEQELIKNGFVSASLGNRVLRTETASLFVLSVINYIFMR